MTTYTTTVRADLVVSVECERACDAGVAAGEATRRLFDARAPLEALRRSAATTARLTWPSGSRRPEIATVTRVDDATFEVTVAACLEVTVEAEAEAGAAVLAGAEGRRLADVYARAAGTVWPVTRAVVCAPGETRDLGALLPEPSGDAPAARVVGVSRAEASAAAGAS